MNWLQKMMYGRHGVDQLSIALMVFYLILSLIFQFTGIAIFYVLSFLCVIYSIFRMFSKNHAKRYAENAKFLGKWNPVQGWLRSKYHYIKGLKTYRYYKCPSCKQTVRIPKGKGKVSITCPKCKTSFIEKVK